MATTIITDISAIIGIISAVATLIVLVFKMVRWLVIAADHLAHIAESHESLVAKIDDLAKVLTEVIANVPTTQKTP